MCLQLLSTNMDVVDENIIIFFEAEKLAHDVKEIMRRKVLVLVLAWRSRLLVTS